MNRQLTVALATLVVLAGCSNPEEPKTSAALETTPPAAPAQQAAPTQQGLPTGHPQMDMSAAEQAHREARELAMQAEPVAIEHRGQVVKVENAGGYSYIEVDMQGQHAVLATTAANVQPGDWVGWGDEAVMNNFPSRALNRTFKQLRMVTQVVPLGEAPASNQGKVLSVNNAAGYSYLEVDQDGKVVWLAAPMTEVADGSTVSWQGGSTMTNFTSSSMNRTFDEIVFVAGVNVSN